MIMHNTVISLTCDGPHEPGKRPKIVVDGPDSEAWAMASTAGWRWTVGMHCLCPACLEAGVKLELVGV